MRGLIVSLALVLAGCGGGLSPGQPGLNSLISQSRQDIDPLICASERGTLINSGLDLNRNLRLETEEIMQTSIVCDGVAGQPAPPSPSAIVALIDPCGDHSGPDEILLQMQDGRFVAWYLDLGLVVLSRGVVYRTTDDQECRFWISPSGRFELR